jgi:hypothetical protein
MAGWLAAASVAVAQSGTPAGSPPGVKGKTLSPYYATASTVDWSGGEESPPELLPPVQSAPAVPAAPAPRSGPIRQAAATVPAMPQTTPAPTLPPTSGTAAPPVAAAPAGPASPVTKPVVPAAPGGSCGPAGCAPTCDCNPCGPNGPCGPAGQYWLDAELLLWWNRGMHTPPLVTSSPVGTPRELAGVGGAPTTRILFGGENVDNQMEPGLRLRAGAWLDECHICGIEGSFFFLGTAPTNHSFSCLDSGIIARPFFDVNPGVPNPFNAQLAVVGSPNSELVCFPGVLNGVVNVNTTTDLYGFDANFIHNYSCCCDYRFDLLVGYRYLNLEDKVRVSEGLTVLSNSNPAIPQGTTFALADSFRTINEFNGGQFGFTTERRSGRWYLSGRNLIALGNTHSETTIAGNTRVTLPTGASMFNSGGLLTQPTNIGTFDNDHFAVVWEAQTTLGYQVTDNIRAFVAYSWLYWSNVSRAGDQIDTVVNSSQIPPGTLNGPARPIFQRRDTEFWTQGVSFGVEMRY